MPNAASILSRDEIDAYRRDGFVVPRYRLPSAALARLQALGGRLVVENPEIADIPIVSPHVPGGGAQNLKAAPGWLEIATHPDIVEMVSGLIGPDVVLWGTTYFYKRAHAGPATPWHRDGRYWPIEPLATTSVWIAVTDSTAENGCLRCIPGSHRAQALGTHRNVRTDNVIFPGSLDAGEYDERKARDIELEAGQMVLFDVFTIHGARHNLGRTPRAGYALRFMPSTSHYHHDAALGTAERDLPGYQHDMRPLFLVRGVDRCGRNDFRRGHPDAAVA